MKERQAAFIHSKQLEKYHYPPDCPFKTERAAKTRQTLNSMGLLTGKGKKEVAPTPASEDLLKTFHTEKYLNALKSSQEGDWHIEALQMGIGGPDTPVFRGMYEYAALACGGSYKGAQMLLSGETDIVFNPSGGYHHAFSELAAGFCYINDAVIAIKHLVKQSKKVLYLDIDVHHGDGVQDAFYNTNNVMTMSLHESGEMLFPGTGFIEEIGKDDGEGYAVNAPLPEGTYDAAYMKLFNEIVPPLINSFNADIIVLELGADVLSGDPLAHLKLTNNVHNKVCNYLRRLDKPILILGGGGYNVENTVRAWSHVWSIMTGESQEFSDMSMGLGGVMMESTDWMGGLQDRNLPATEEQKNSVDPIIDSTIQKIKKVIFPLHGIE